MNLYLALLLIVLKSTPSLARKFLDNVIYLVNEFLQSYIYLSLSNEIDEMCQLFYSLSDDQRTLFLCSICRLLYNLIVAILN